MNEGKVLQFKHKSRSVFRKNRTKWNYFQSLFYISLSFNLLLLMLLVCKSL